MIRKILEEFKDNEINISSLKTTLEGAQQYGDIEPAIELRKTIESSIAKAIEKRYRAFSIIEKIDDPVKKQIFYSRFIDRKSNSEISRELGYSINHISKIIRKGIEELEKLEGY